MISSRAVTMLSLALLTACGSDSSPERKLDLQGFVAEYADTMCSALVRCSCTDASALADCKTVYEEYLSLSSAEMFLSHPGARIEPAAARTCLADLAAALETCPSPTGGSSMVDVRAPLAVASGPALRSSPVTFLDVASCREELLIVGVQAEGEYCSSTVECAPGLACDGSARECVTAPAENASCARTDSCATGLYCGTGAVCLPIPAADEGCDGDARVCAPGTRCVLVSETYTCVAPHVLDADCTDGAGCAAGLHCDGTCKPLIADGGDCEYDSQCAHDWCNDDGKCVDAGFCATVSDIRK